MAQKYVKEFLDRGVWGELDYLIVDLPPGTGDIPRAGCYLELFFRARYFFTQGDVPVITGGDRERFVCSEEIIEHILLGFNRFPGNQ